MKSKPVAVPSPQVILPASAESLEAEVIRLRRMVHALAEMLVECGVVDASMVEGRLRLASVEVEAPPRRSWWARLFRRQELPVGALPTVMMPPSSIDQTMPVQKMPFEVQSLYDETAPSVVAPAMAQAARVAVGNCQRCWRRAPLNPALLCVRCAVQEP